MGPLLAPLWGYGLWRLWREPRYRAFPVTYVLLFVVFLLTAGKAYRIDNGLGIDEQGEPLFVCRELRAPWHELWPRAKYLG
ncbi:hypothetical protein ABZV58_31575 [Nocardia sp. NPDC004654]|uniref:hypothetical protein n=1 Tax=Nocardia sp. NPDC004654 TaxID=3154776 RepID=UPI0033B674A9